MTPPGPPPPVAAILAACPDPVRSRLEALRDLIYAAAGATGTGPLTETLKWGQPAYLGRKSDGTTIRLGWSPKTPDHVALHVHCQTDLVDRWRLQFAGEFGFEGNRTVRIPVKGAFSEAAVQQMAAMALTYHRDKRQGGRAAPDRGIFDQKEARGRT